MKAQKQQFNRRFDMRARDADVEALERIAGRYGVNRAEAARIAIAQLDHQLLSEGTTASMSPDSAYHPDRITARNARWWSTVQSAYEAAGQYSGFAASYALNLIAKALGKPGGKMDALKLRGKINTALIIDLRSKDEASRKAIIHHLSTPDPEASEADADWQRHEAMVLAERSTPARQAPAGG